MDGVLDYNRKKSITRLEITVRMETTTSTTVRINPCQDGKIYQDGEEGTQNMALLGIGVLHFSHKLANGRSCFSL